MACFMFLAVNLTRVTSTLVFFQPVVTHPLDLSLKIGGPSDLRIPVSHFVRDIAISLILLLRTKIVSAIRRCNYRS
jgi:hypothetical protein